MAAIFAQYMHNKKHGFLVLRDDYLPVDMHESMRDACACGLAKKGDKVVEILAFDSVEGWQTLQTREVFQFI